MVTTRQISERAWHAPMMICTTAYEKDAAFKAYLRQAIAKFATVVIHPFPRKSQHILNRKICIIGFYFGDTSAPSRLA
ncbi:hypothetical protein EV44_g3221 [Erysiphe necator]|uniref:Uncharacterized protein n=1 Tax=Uncinula necator TaxID=52586 RepID=A0A0B1P059_UNCNE|nr:hypothetical protein EV44_g3221 [Erysiphe necator]